MAREAAQLFPMSPDSLLEGWEKGTTSSGQIFWSNSTIGIKTYYDPIKPSPHSDGFAAIPLEGSPLPEGWEILGRTQNGRNEVIFLDHNTRTSSAVDPRLGPLPNNWESGRTSSGQTFWTNADQGLKTFYDPRKGYSHSGGFEPILVEGGPLPEGWEAVGKEVDGRMVVSYLDHNSHSSTPEDPRI